MIENTGSKEPKIGKESKPAAELPSPEARKDEIDTQQQDKFKGKKDSVAALGEFKKDPTHCTKDLISRDLKKSSTTRGVISASALQANEAGGSSFLIRKPTPQPINKSFIKKKSLKLLRG